LHGFARAYPALLALVLWAEPARAEDLNQQALKLAYQADDLYARGQWAAAYDRFAEADGLAHSPVFVLYMARCRKNAGKLLEAESIFARLAQEKVAGDAPKPFREAVASAASERDEVARRIPHVQVVVRDAEGAVVRVDGKEVPDPRAFLPLDPGLHVFEVSSGGVTAKEEKILPDGAGEVKIVLALAEPRRASPETSEGSLVPAIVLASAGALGVGVGSVTGLMASSKASAVKKGCVDGHCLASDAGALDDARSLARISTIGFVVGGACVAAAGALFVWRPGRTSQVALMPKGLRFSASF
jgi:hypothetical protein